MTHRPLLTSIIAAALILAAATLMKFARNAGLLDTTDILRISGVFAGLTLAFIGNFIPKTVHARRTVEQHRRFQPSLRISGWSFTLAGLAHAGLSLLEPNQTAHQAAVAAIAIAVVISLATLLWCLINPGKSPAAGK